MNQVGKKSRNGNGTLSYFISIGILISVLFSIAALTISLQPEAEAKVVEPFLVVEDVYFVMTPSMDSADLSDKQVTMTAYVTNQGKEDASNVEARVFAIDSETNLGVDYNQATIGLIPQDTTGETTMSLVVPQGKTYRVELIVFESGKIVVRGSGTIKLIGSSGTAGEDFKTENSRGNGPSGDSNEDKDTTALGSIAQADESGAAFAGVALVVSILVIIAIIAVAVKSKPTEKDDRLPKVQNTQIGAIPRPVAVDQNGSNPKTMDDEPQQRKLVWEQGV